MEEIHNQEMVHHLYVDDKEVVLIGTAHVSRESTVLVKDIIEKEKPDTVCVELCESRYQSITDKDRWLNTDIVKIIKDKKAFLLLSNLLLASFQKRIAKKLEVNPGEEMLVAISGAKAIGAHIHDNGMINLGPLYIIRHLFHQMIYFFI